MKCRIWQAAILLSLMLVLCFSVHAEDLQAQEISSENLVTERENIADPYWLFDRINYAIGFMGANSRLTLEDPRGIGSLYFLFDQENGPYWVVNGDTGERAQCGLDNFLHDYVDLTELFDQAPKKVSIEFGDHPVKLGDLRVFTEGEPPADVQRWERAPEDGVDLMLCSAHSDDEQLFFAGVLPYYAGELDYPVQLVTFTRHRNQGAYRSHELLNGLWAVGVKTYPVMGEFDDYYCEGLQQGYTVYERSGITEDIMLSYVVEQIRQYKPLVVLGHDVNGEYGHGAHCLYSDLVQKAVGISMDPEAFPESAEKWGTWDVPKTYLHAYPENIVHMDWNQPLTKFDGMTAYQVCKTYGFPAHESQYKGFAWYTADSDRGEDIEDFGPSYYGLFRTTVGPDQEKNDFFENLTTREEQKRLEEEKLRQQEEAPQTEPSAEVTASQETAASSGQEPTEPALQENAGTPKLLWIGLAAAVLIIAVLAVSLTVRKNNKK